MKKEKIISKCNKEGVDARTLPPEKQSIIQMTLEEWLEAIMEEVINKLNLMGNYLKAKLEEKIERLKEVSMNLPVEFHKTNFRIGIIYTIPFILIILAEIWLNNWKLSPYDLAFEGLLISIVITTIGSLGLHLLLAKLKNDNPRWYSKIKMFFIASSVIMLLLATPFLSQVRGEVAQAQRENDDLGKIAEKDKFFEKTSMSLIATMMFIGLSMFLVAGLTLHEALLRLVTSGRVVKIQKDIETLREKLIVIAREIESWKQIVKLGMIEFKRGLYSGEMSDRKFWLFPLSVFFAVMTFGILSMGTLHAKERESVIILLDISRSTAYRIYSQKTDF